MAKHSETASVAAIGGMRFDRRPIRRSRLTPAALAAAATADTIPIQGKWRAGSSLLFIIFASAALWAGIVAAGMALVHH